MGNPLIVFWRMIFGGDHERAARPRRHVVLATAAQASATIFLVLRRMRAPLILLILIFAVSVLGLTLIPGVDAEGQPWRMSIFEAFYFMSYTATTIGFGELPFTFTNAQRMWVVVAIYLTVIGWAYAIGSLLALLQDRAFRDALALQRFTRKVSRLGEPFLLIAGYGRTGQLLGRSFDALGRRFVVLDLQEERINSLDLDPYHADVPALVGDARNPGHLGIAGLNHANCEGVVALTDDDEVNLSVAMSVALLRPDLPVVARTVSPTVEERMRAFGSPTVVNPFDSFGDQLRLALRAPTSYQLLTWLESGLGAELPPRGHPPRSGRWLVCGYGRFGRELTADLRAEGLDVTVIEPRLDGDPDPWVVVGDGSDPAVLTRAGVEQAVGFVAGTDNDITNLSMVTAAVRLNPDLYVAARQNQPANAPLFTAMDLDSLLVPTEVIAHEVYAQLSTPLLWHFVQEIPRQDDAWAATLIGRLVRECGRRLDALWKVRLTEHEAPAVVPWLPEGLTLGALLRDPDEPDVRLEVVPLLLRRDGRNLLAPDDDTPLAAGDELLLAGQPSARRELDTTLLVDAAAAYVITGRRRPAGWLWRRLAGSSTGGVR
jgi:Trk K+ transport system NAD-binding subunit